MLGLDVFWTFAHFFYLYMFFGPGCILDVLRTWGKEIVADVLMCFLDPVGIIFVEF